MVVSHQVNPAVRLPAFVSFNSSFYIVVTIVLTLLWIAVLLPGGPLARVVPASRAAGREDGAGGLPARFVSWTALSAAVLSCVAFMLGEVCALVALADSSASSFQHSAVLASAIVLTVTAGLMALLFAMRPSARGSASSGD